MVRRRSKFTLVRKVDNSIKASIIPFLKSTTKNLVVRKGYEKVASAVIPALAHLCIKTRSLTVP